MSKKKAKMKTVFVLENGEQYDVIAETGKYYICVGGTQFRKSAKRGKAERVNETEE